VGRRSSAAPQHLPSPWSGPRFLTLENYPRAVALRRALTSAALVTSRLPKGLTSRKALVAPLANEHLPTALSVSCARTDLHANRLMLENAEDSRIKRLRRFI
jgi:hypothetical protein